MTALCIVCKERQRAGEMRATCKRCSWTARRDSGYWMARLARFYERRRAKRKISRLEYELKNEAKEGASLRDTTVAILEEPRRTLGECLSILGKLDGIYGPPF